uniref:Putative RNA polymerase n=1 Tax=viral metagenome TaxID=1070528 RepID=A0A6M3K7N2_9ZZZZ
MKRKLNLTDPVSSLNLSTRIVNCLNNSKHCISYEINTIDDILKTGKIKLLSMKHFGKKSFNEIETALFMAGIENPFGKKQSNLRKKVKEIFKKWCNAL